MSNSPLQNVYASRPLPWRQVTPLHVDMGPRIIKNNVQALAAATPLDLFNAPYGPQTIDRIIGCKLRCNYGAALSITISEALTEFSATFKKTDWTGEISFNIESLPDQAHIMVETSGIIAAANKLQVVFFNFELPPAELGFG